MKNKLKKFLKTQILQKKETLLDTIPIRITAEVGNVDVDYKTLNDLDEGSIVAFKQLAHEPVLVKANGQPVAWGEIIVVDEQFGIRITNMLTAKQQIELLGRKDIVPHATIKNK